MIFNDLAVFMERGVFRLSVPPTNPANWFMLEAHENIGCIAPDSIVKAGQFVFLLVQTTFICWIPILILQL